MNGSSEDLTTGCSSVRTAEHRRSQGVHWVHVHPSAQKEVWGNLPGKVVGAPPQVKQEVKYFRTFCWAGAEWLIYQF